MERDHSIILMCVSGPGNVSGVKPQAGGSEGGKEKVKEGGGSEGNEKVKGGREKARKT